MTFTLIYLVISFCLGGALTEIRLNRRWRARLAEELEQQQKQLGPAAQPAMDKDHPAVRLRKEVLEAEKKRNEIFDEVLEYRLQGLSWSQIVTEKESFIRDARRKAGHVFLRVFDQGIISDAKRWAEVRGYKFQVVENQSFGERTATGIHITGWMTVAEKIESGQPPTVDPDKDRILRELDEELARAAAIKE